MSSISESSNSQIAFETSLAEFLEDVLNHQETAAKHADQSRYQSHLHQQHRRLKQTFTKLRSELKYSSFSEQIQHHYLAQLIHAVFRSKLFSPQPKTTYEKLADSIDNLHTYSVLISPYFETGDAQELLWFAITHNQQALAEQAIHKGAQVNGLLHPGMSPLRLACRKGNLAMARFLLSQGANPKQIGGTHQHGLPITELGYHQQIQLDQIFDPQTLAFSTEYEERKFLAHFFPSQHLIQVCSELESQTYCLEGARPRLFLSILLKQRLFLEELSQEILAAQGTRYARITSHLSPEAKQQFDLNPLLRASFAQALTETLDTLKACFQSELLDRRLTSSQVESETMHRLERNLLVIAFQVTGSIKTWSTGAPNLHAWGLVVTKDTSSENERYLVQRCNRGLGSGKYPGILCTSMNRHEMLCALIEYNSATHWKSDHRNKQIHFCKESSDKVEKMFLTSPNTIETRYSPIDQQVNGNCCYSSLTTILSAAIRAPLIHSLGLHTSFALSQGVVGLFEDHLRNSLLNRYLERHFGELEHPIPCDFHLLAEVLFNLPNPHLQEAPYFPKLSAMFREEADKQLLAPVDFKHPNEILRFYFNTHILQALRTHRLLNGIDPHLEFTSSLIHLKHTNFLIKTLNEISPLARIESTAPFTRSTLSSVREALPYFASLKTEVNQTPPENSLSALYWALLDHTEPTPSQEIQSLFHQIPTYHQHLIRTHAELLGETPFNLETIGFPLFFASLHNALLAAFDAASPEKQTMLIEETYAIKAFALEDSFHKTPQPYQEAFTNTLAKFNLKPLNIFAEGSQLLICIKAFCTPSRPGFAKDLDFSAFHPSFYQPLVTDPLFFLSPEDQQKLSPEQLISVKHSMAKRNPARLALLLSLNGDLGQHPAGPASSSS